MSPSGVAPPSAILPSRRSAETGHAGSIEPLRVGVLAPPWVPVPPRNYGGTELILDVLCRGLVGLGHEVTLFTVGESTCPVPKKSLFDTADPHRMGAAVLELRHAAAAYDAFEGFDIVHDHTLAGPFLSRPQAPAVVTTNHGPFDADLSDLYRRLPSVPLIAISHDQALHAPSDIRVDAVIHHGLDLGRYSFDATGGDYLVSLGRMSPTKGIDVAIDIARRAGMELVIAAKMREPLEEQYFDSVVRPKLGSGVEYVGEVDHPTKVALLRGARALVNPIRWSEPFGLVMAESLACGTPVVAARRGAAPEIIDHGVTGFLGEGVEELVSGVLGIDQLERSACRDAVRKRFSMERMAHDHAAFYTKVLNERPRGAPTLGAAASTATDLRVN